MSDQIRVTVVLIQFLPNRYKELAIREGIEATNVGPEECAGPPAYKDDPNHPGDKDDESLTTDKDDVNPPAAKVDASPPKAPQQPKMIPCDVLYKLMKEKGTNLLIMDCRPEAEFGSSRLIYRDYVNVPEKVIRHGFVSTHLFYNIILSVRLLLIAFICFSIDCQQEISTRY